MFDFKFPDVGEGITEGEIVKWKVKEGESIKQDQVIVEIETDKAIVEIPIPKAGTVAKLYGKEGDVVKVGSVLITVDESGKGIKQAEVQSAKTEEQPRKSYGVVGSLPEYEETNTTPIPTKTTTLTVQPEIKALPAVRKLAEEKGVDLSTITPTGENGIITKEDVLLSLGETKVSTSTIEETSAGVKITARDYDIYGYIEKIPLKGVRKKIADHLLEATHKTAPVTHFDEVDVTHLVEIREKEKVALEKKGIHLTYLPFVIKSVIAALKLHPYFNANIDDEHQEILLKKYYNIGFAVDTPDGLIVPVLKIADKKTIEQIAVEVQKLADATRRRIVDLGDLKGGTFTITNIGSIGGTYATPIINYPEVAILLPGKIYDKPVARDGKVVIRKIMPLSLTFDHRVVDGAAAARFVNEIKSYLEDPDKLLMELE
ncbi:MAG TPA: dihydrolipoamide acetyltransferase family protein [Candidatus Nanoarchaeia archaeon]|nr:dihydrolipoamide acetyltransferase family protein [Candidatus Nanoarchaeia archaeon]